MLEVLVSCDQCGNPLVVNRVEVCDDEVAIKVEPCVGCMEYAATEARRTR